MREDAAGGRQVDLYAERHEVRETVEEESVHWQDVQLAGQHCAVFFGARDRGAPASRAELSSLRRHRLRLLSGPPRRLRRHQTVGPGSSVNHPKYGHGMVLRREGDGEDAKLTVSFPGYGLKKLVEKYAGIKLDE